MKNPESIHQFSEHLEANNKLQIELAKRYAENSDSANDGLLEEKIIEWVNLNSEKFRELVLIKISENPNFWSDLEDPDMKEALLEEFEKDLYLKKDYRKMAA